MKTFNGRDTTFASSLCQRDFSQLKLIPQCFRQPSTVNNVYVQQACERGTPRSDDGRVGFEERCNRLQATKRIVLLVRSRPMTRYLRRNVYAAMVCVGRLRSARSAWITIHSTSVGQHGALITSNAPSFIACRYSSQSSTRDVTTIRAPIFAARDALSKSLQSPSASIRSQNMSPTFFVARMSLHSRRLLVATGSRPRLSRMFDNARRPSISADAITISQGIFIDVLHNSHFQRAKDKSPRTSSPSV